MSKFAQAILLMLLCGAAHAEVAVPSWTQPIMDLTGTLRPEQIYALRQKVSALEASKGAQIAVLIVPTTGSESVFEYAMRVFESWKPGRKGVDDGLLWVIAADTGKWFIATGYGLEGALPDVKIKHIATEFIDPHFNRSEGYAGLDAGLTELIKIIETEPLPPRTIDHSVDGCVSETPRGAVPIPPWAHPVIDLTGTLDPARMQALNQRLQAFEDRKGAQIGMLIVPTTRTESIDQFTNRVCERWLGHNGSDNGVIMTMNLDTSQLYVVVGRGLDQMLNNTKLSEIINEIIGPNLRLREYDNGIEAGMDAIMAVVDNIPLPPPDHSWTASVGKMVASTANMLEYILEKYFGALILAALFGIAALYRYRRRQKGNVSIPG